MGERTVRNVASDDDIKGFLWCMRTGFLAGKDITDEMVSWCRERWDLSRTWSAFDEGELCGTSRTFGSRLRLPGLADVPVSCLTQVTVLPTHTRRGHLTRMMRAQLEHAIEAGEVASLLVAAEWPIYGRFGYGPATEWGQWEVDTSIARVLGTPYGRCRLVDPAALEKAAAVVLARQQAVTPGSIERPQWLLAMQVGSDPRPGEEKHESRVRVVHEDDDGEPDAFAMYDPKERWDGMRPNSTLTVEDHVAASAEAQRELLRYLVDVDLAEKVCINGIAESRMRHVLADGRAARQVGRWDHIWARLLDVPACLSARAYSVSARVVVEVVDHLLGRGGRFALDVSPEGASCAPAPSATPDVTLPVAALGATWLGGPDLRDVAAGGTVDEHSAGALERLAAALRWHQHPDCTTDF